MVGLYFLNALANLIEELEKIQPLTVLYHYGPVVAGA